MRAFVVFFWMLAAIAYPTRGSCPHFVLVPVSDQADFSTARSTIRPTLGFGQTLAVPLRVTSLVAGNRFYLGAWWACRPRYCGYTVSYYADANHNELLDATEGLVPSDTVVAPNGLIYSGQITPPLAIGETYWLVATVRPERPENPEAPKCRQVRLELRSLACACYDEPTPYPEFIVPHRDVTIGIMLIDGWTPGLTVPSKSELAELAAKEAKEVPSLDWMDGLRENGLLESLTGGNF
jgi:hypothetical protein